MIYNLQRKFWSMYGRLIWDKHQPPWKQEQIERVVKTIEYRSQGAQGKLLDAGCGTGDYTVALAQAGFDAVGVDYASGMLYCAEKKITPAVQNRLSFQQMSLDRPLLFDDDEFDHVINISVLQVTRDPHFALSEVRRVLKTHGTLFLLHVPKPDYHGWSLWDLIRFRIDHTESANLLEKTLIVAKAWGDWIGKGSYWTVDEVGTMIRDAGFEIINVEAEPVIIIEARKSH